MSLTIEGTLAVKSISGAKGSFCVGDLQTAVGSFRVKDALLDEFEPGQYAGRFVIGLIYPASYTWRGKVFVEVRAKVEQILLDECHETPVSESEHEQESEPDPLLEQKSPATAHPLPADPLSDRSAKPDPSPTEQEPAPLFDAEMLSLIEQGGPVKLDPAGIDRALFRQQRDELKARGFRFVAQSQHWIRDPS